MLAHITQEKLSSDLLDIEILGEIQDGLFHTYQHHVRLECYITCCHAA